MSRKLEGNGLWESSRMMLPEHKEAFIQHRSRPSRRLPQLDEQQRERIAAILSWSQRQKGAVAVTYWDDGKVEKIVGIVAKIDAGRQKLHIQGNSKSKWLPFNAILDVDSCQPWEFFGQLE